MSPVSRIPIVASAWIASDTSDGTGPIYRAMNGKPQPKKDGDMQKTCTVRSGG